MSSPVKGSEIILERVIEICKSLGGYLGFRIHINILLHQDLYDLEVTPEGRIVERSPAFLSKVTHVK